MLLRSHVCKLAHLPTELLVFIFSLTSGEDAVQLNRTCMLFYRIFEDHAIIWNTFTQIQYGFDVPRNVVRDFYRKILVPHKVEELIQKCYECTVWTYGMLSVCYWEGTILCYFGGQNNKNRPIDALINIELNEEHDVVYKCVQSDMFIDPPGIPELPVHGSSIIFTPGGLQIQCLEPSLHRRKVTGFKFVKPKVI